MSSLFRNTRESEQPIQIRFGAGVLLRGDLAMPERTRGIVLFAHGSGSSRTSPRNRYVAQALRGDGLATLLFDLMTEDEEAGDEDGRFRFDIGLLTSRLLVATDWVKNQIDIRDLNLGYFGASTGAAAALAAAAERPDDVKAVVSRGGRPDLVLAALPRVKAPTLLIVGGADSVVLDLNRRALERLTSPKKLAVIPGATHLFEEPGALQKVGQTAAEWFKIYLVEATA